MIDKLVQVGAHRTKGGGIFEKERVKERQKIKWKRDAEGGGCGKG